MSESHPDTHRAGVKRLSELGLRQARGLGQNFLVDDNILRVIEREAELGADDVVLEVGGGLGVLSEFLSPRVSFVHVYEIDRRLAPALREAVGERENVALLFEDAMKAELGALDPPPGKMVSNLPYSVAVPLILRTIKTLAKMNFWCVMVQREIADRLKAEPGTKEYGAPSVIAQLSCEVKFLRPISRTVFVPPPNVDSALIRLQRKGPAATESVRALVKAAFAHRRKALPKSLSLAAESNPRLRQIFSREPEELRSIAKEGLGELGEPADQRAERLRPEQFVELAALIGGSQ